MMIRKVLAVVIVGLFVWGCEKDDPEAGGFELTRASVGTKEVNLDGTLITEVLPDRPVSLSFSSPVDPESIGAAITIGNDQGLVDFTVNTSSENKDIVVFPIGVLASSSVYTVRISDQLRGVGNEVFSPVEIKFKTISGKLELTAFELEGVDVRNSFRVQDIDVQLNARVTFSEAVNTNELTGNITVIGPTSPNLEFVSDDNKTISITSSVPLEYLRKYTFRISDQLVGANQEPFQGYSKEFYTELDSTFKFPEISDEELLTKVQAQTFRYFWDFAHPISGLARERNTSGETVTIGGSGFGVMTILVGIERGFITRQEGIDRLETIMRFLGMADRFHGVWPHWMNGSTGAVIPFSADDDGGDLVETAFMIQGLLAVRQYLDEANPQEAEIKTLITQLWEEVEWDWHTQGGQNVLYWHWSPNFGWQKNHKIQGWNEALIIYVLAASSPTHAIDASVYQEGWTRNGNMVNGNNYYSIDLPLGGDRGGPLFFSHYSFLGLDPRNLSDQYANYWEQNVSHTLINRAYCVDNPANYVGYGATNWGLTASDSNGGYSAHSPTNDKGVITPTAALSSFPYTPNESMEALRHFYYYLGDKLWGDYGFYDAFNSTENWYANSYLAIDQGPIVIMIENHRTALLWDLFMADQEIRQGLNRLNFSY